MVTSRLLLSITALLLGFVIFSCSTKNVEDSNNSSIVPDSIITKGNDYLISIVGKDFFEQNIKFDREKSSQIKSNYQLYYNFQIAGLEYIDEEIYFFLDNSGKLVEKYDVVGVPNCNRKPEECDFNISKNKAIEISKGEGMQDGIKDWIVDFEWDSQLRRYAWHIRSTYREIGEGEFYKASGEEAIISTNDGKVLKFRKWNIF